MFFIVCKFSVLQAVVVGRSIESTEKKRAGFENILMSFENILKALLTEQCLDKEESN